MLSGVKVIPRDQLDKGRDDSSDSSLEDRRRRSGSKKEKLGRKKKYSRYGSSDEDLQRIKKVPRKKKWYLSDEESSPYSSGSDGGSSQHEQELLDRKKKKKIDCKEQEDVADIKKKRKKHGKEASPNEEKFDSDFDDQKIVRREMGLEWMLKPKEKIDRSPVISVDKEPLQPPPNEEPLKVNPRELNPYLKNNGSGYPEEEEDHKKSGGEKLLSSSVVGDGGASWRLKALKRAKEQAAREGRNMEEVVAERWGSLGNLAVSVASHRAAPTHAHLHAIRSRKQGSTEGEMRPDDEDSNNRKSQRNYLKGVSVRNSDMRVPKVDDSLSWRRRRGHKVSSGDAELISAAVSNLNKFANDGSFMQEALRQPRIDSDDPLSSRAACDGTASEGDKPYEPIAQGSEGLSANQLAAKALQLRMKGKHEEAETLLNEVEKLRNKQQVVDQSTKLGSEGGTTMHVLHDVSLRRKNEDDADTHLAKIITQNRRFSISGQADDEYDFDGAPKRKSRKKGANNDQKAAQSSALAKRILTQQERCFFCFENQQRPKHLVVSIANFTYLMLPHQQPVVAGHCCIATLQHESATRTVDDNVWEEIRNFKKCLIMMFAKQEKELVFLETVMGLAQQRRHCLIECIPLPREAAKEAPLYFKKAIDEAENEWSQHNAKKLIDTSVKGLRASIPKHFPYFHVEFGLNRGFVHVIDDEKEFRSSFGLNVIRGMMHLPEEDMYRRRRSQSVDSQTQAVASFVRDWEPFDWTKQLDQS